MGVAAANRLECENDVERHRATLRRAEARRARLERLFSDSVFVDKVLKQSRYLRLCSAIAWASEREERARLAVDIDVQVETLRLAASPAPPAQGSINKMWQ